MGDVGIVFKLFENFSFWKFIKYILYTIQNSQNKNTPPREGALLSHFGDLTENRTPIAGMRIPCPNR